MKSFARLMIAAAFTVNVQAEPIWPPANPSPVKVNVYDEVKDCDSKERAYEGYEIYYRRKNTIDESSPVGKKGSVLGVDTTAFDYKADPEKLYLLDPAYNMWHGFETDLGKLGLCKGSKVTFIYPMKDCLYTCNFLGFVGVEPGQFGYDKEN